MNQICVRCGSTEKLEEDHIIPKSDGGLDEESNKRFLCEGCHDFRHAKDDILRSIEIQLERYRKGWRGFNGAKLSMLFMRLGALEALNTPQLIRQRGFYKSYWDISATHYSRWYPEIKRIRGIQKEGLTQRTLLDNKQH